MKKFAMLVLCSSILALTSNPAKASPTSEDHSTISEVVLKDMATPFVISPITKFEILCEVNFAPALLAIDVAAVPSTLDDTVKPVKNPASPDDGRIRMYRHYFNHEDNKEYPEYQVDKLSDGFIRPVDRPAV